MEKINSDNENLYKALPTAVKERLPKYYRTLRTLIGDDILRTRSADLARFMKITPSQVDRTFHIWAGLAIRATVTTSKTCTAQSETL